MKRMRVNPVEAMMEPSPKRSRTNRKPPTFIAGRYAPSTSMKRSRINPTVAMMEPQPKRMRKRPRVKTRRPRSKSSPELVKRKKFDLREIGHSLKRLFTREPDVKPLETFTNSNLGRSYMKHYIQHEEEGLEAKIRKIESRHNPKRPDISARLIKRRRRPSTFRRTSSQERTAKDNLDVQDVIAETCAGILGTKRKNAYAHVQFPFPDEKQTIQGSFSQANIPKVERISRHLNQQCTSMAYTAIVAAKNLPTTYWTPKFMDRLVVTADRLHHQTLINRMWKPGTTERLAVDEVQTFPQDTRSCWPFKVLPTKHCHGLVIPQTDIQRKNLRDMNGMSLQQAIEECYGSRADGCLVTVGAFSTAVIKDPTGRHCVFDSHSNSRYGWGGSGGASLYTFDSLEHLCKYYAAKHGNLEVFNVAGLEVENLTPDKICR